MDYLTMAVAAALALLAAILIWLLKEHQKLKQDYRALAAQLLSYKEDVAGLCAAAVVVDQHLVANDVRLNGILEQLAVSQTPASAVNSSPVDEPHGYDTAIQKIRHGADVEALVKDCGLTRDEAVLLMRLHSSAKRL